MDIPKEQQVGTGLTRHRCKLGLLTRALSKLSFRSRGRSASRDQSASRDGRSALLDLPVELLAQILRLVPPDTLLVASETCVALRRLSHAIRDGRGLTRSEHLRYLTTLVRDKPDAWVCGQCMAIRKPSTTDTPYIPVLPLGCLIRGPSHEDPEVVCEEIPLDRHVQRALKYYRLYNSHGSQKRGLLAREVLLFRLGLIVAPSETTFGTNPFYKQYMADQTVVSKIVQGHFLVCSTWDFWAESYYKEPYLRAMGFLRICHHQGFLYTGDTRIKDPAASLDLVRRKMPEYSSRVPAAERWLRAQPSVASLNKLPAALQEAREFGQEVQRSCDACPSDFTVKVGRNLTVIRLWQDLGCEGPPINLPRTPENLRRGGPCNPLGLTHITHVPGSVRERYEGRSLHLRPIYRT